MISSYILTLKEIKNIHIGDIYKRNNYKQYDNSDPFNENINVCARIIDIKENDNGQIWVKYYLYKQGDIVSQIEATQDAYSFLLMFNKI